MNHLSKFRAINEIERNIIADSVFKISSQSLSILNKKEFKFYISFNRVNIQDSFPKIYLVPHILTENLENVNPEIIISSAGLYFGFIKRSQFFLSLEGADLLYKLNAIPQKQKLLANDKGEKAILYGNNIKKNFVSLIPTTLKKHDLLFVFNKLNELISIAKSQVDYSVYKNLKPNDKFALNLVDKGYYLRKKQ